MSDVKSGRVHILRQLAVPGGVAAEDTGNHFLLSLTWRSERCRSGSEIPRARLYERQGAKGWSRGVEGCGIRHELNDRLLSMNVNSQNGWFLAGSSPTATSIFSQSLRALRRLASRRKQT